LDAGSGAKHCIAPKMIEEINNLGLPIIVGGGIRNANQIKAAHEAGAQIVVVGNKLEEDPEFLNEIKNYKEEFLKCDIN
jgi:putative glycerol-1-phosphate prenyltransferase